MQERREGACLPSWTESLLTPEQRRTLRRRFGLPDDGDPDVVSATRFVDPDVGGRGGGGTPAPTSPSAPASLTRPADADADDRG